MEFIPLISPRPRQTLKAAEFPKHGEKYLMENKTKQKYKTFYPRNLIKTSNKEQEKGQKDSNSCIYIILRINLIK